MNRDEGCDLMIQSSKMPAVVSSPPRPDPVGVAARQRWEQYNSDGTRAWRHARAEDAVSRCSPKEHRLADHVRSLEDDNSANQHLVEKLHREKAELELALIAANHAAAGAEAGGELDNGFRGTAAKSRSSNRRHNMSHSWSLSADRPSSLASSGAPVSSSVALPFSAAVPGAGTASKSEQRDAKAASTANGSGDRDSAALEWMQASKGGLLGGEAGAAAGDTSAPPLTEAEAETVAAEEALRRVRDRQRMVMRACLYLHNACASCVFVSRSARCTTPEAV